MSFVVCLILNLLMLISQAKVLNLSKSHQHLRYSSRLGSQDEDMLYCHRCPRFTRHQLNLLANPDLQLFYSSGCHSTELQLSCVSGMLVVEGAYFQPSNYQEKLNCSRVETHSRPILGQVEARHGDRDLQRELNRRCSGFTAATDCRYNLILDSKEARSWGPGIVKVWHRCVPGQDIQKKCGTEVRGRGFIMSGSYPKYYMGAQVCSWKINVNYNELVIVKVVDLQLEEASANCQDSLIVDRRVSMCGELGRKTMYMSDHGTLISFNTSTSHQYIYPRRGFLLEYITLTCYPPTTFNTFNLLFKNQTHATYKCIQGWVFNETESPTQSFLCAQSTVYGLPAACVAGQQQELVGPSTPSLRLSVSEGDRRNVTEVWMQEVLLPLVLLVFLLILSLAGLILLTLAKRHRMEEEHRTELQANTFTITTLDAYQHYKG